MTIKRSDRDGEVSVERTPLGDLRIAAHTNDVGEEIFCTEFNARRLLAALSMVLELPLSKASIRALDNGEIVVK